MERGPTLMAATKRRAAAYVRVTENGDAGASPVRQLEAIKGKAEAKGYKVEDTDVYEDTGNETDALEALMARMGEYKMVVFEGLDRLAPTAARLADVLRAAEALHTYLVSVRDEFDTATKTGKAQAEMALRVAGMEGKAQGERVRSAQEEALREGRWIGGRVPYGWTSIPDGQHRVLAVKEDEATVIREAVGRVLDGESVRSVAQHLNQKGAEAPMADSWSDSTLMRVLRSPLLIGIATYGGEMLRDEKGEPVQTHPPILKPAEWRRLQERLDERSPSRRKARKTLLSGLVVCDECGTPMVGRSADRPNSTYSCRKREDCPGNAISRAWLDEFVSEAVTSYLSPAYLRSARKRVASPDSTIDAAKAEATRHALDRLVADRYEHGLYDSEEGEAFYRREWERLSAELQRLTGLRHKVEMTEEERVIDLIPEEVEDLATVWERMPEDDRRRVIEAVVEEVRVRKGQRGGAGGVDSSRVNIVWR